MKKLLIGGWLIVAALTMTAGSFPYGSEMAVRHSKESAEVLSFAPVEIPAVNGGMPTTDSVATLFASVVGFAASNEEDWAVGTNAIGSAQAALTLRLVDGDYKWMGYTDGNWVEFAASGVPAAEGEWEVCIEIDYSLGAGNEKIRYSVGRAGSTLVPLAKVGGGEWVALGNPKQGIEQKIEHVYLYGSGETGLVEAKSGMRSASGTIAVHEDCGAKWNRLALDVTVTDSWGVDSVKVVLTDKDGNRQTGSAALSADGTAQVVFSDGIKKGEIYEYELSLTGSYRGKDISCTDKPHDVLVGIRVDWFTFENGAFAKATKDANVTIADNQLSADAISPRGIVLPDSAAPKGTVGVTLEATLMVAGAVRELALAELDADNALGGLTVVRFLSGERGWVCRTPDGWVRLFGVTAANGTYEVRTELDYGDGNKIAYSVKNGDAFVRLVDVNGDAWFALPAQMRKVSLLGGSIVSLVASCVSAPIKQTGFVVIFN